MTNTYKAEWTGKYPNHCSGEWHLYCNGTELQLPESVKYKSMETYGGHSRFYFTGNWEVEWENYEDGLELHDWIKENQEWLNKIAESEDFEAIYWAFNEHDWRHGECGGCI